MTKKMKAKLYGIAAQICLLLMCVFTSIFLYNIYSFNNGGEPINLFGFLIDKMLVVELNAEEIPYDVAAGFENKDDYSLPTEPQRLYELEDAIIKEINRQRALKEGFKTLTKEDSLQKLTDVEAPFIFENGLDARLSYSVTDLYHLPTIGKRTMGMNIKRELTSKEDYQRIVNKIVYEAMNDVILGCSSIHNYGFAVYGNNNNLVYCWNVA